MHVGELLLRFAIGGTVVSVFALMGDLVRPESFGGLFGAAPSVALATLGLIVITKGTAYAATEARSMAAGAIAFIIYVSCVKKLIVRFELSALGVTTLLLPLWLLVAGILWVGVWR
jgi:hypothetical protein